MSKILDLFWNKKKKEAPAEEPLQVFERVLSERRTRYETLRQLTLELIFRRVRATAEAQNARFAIARLHAEERAARAAGATEEADLLRHARGTYEVDLGTAKDTLLESIDEARVAKRRLSELGAEIRRLEAERRAAASRLAYRRFRTSAAPKDLGPALDRAREELERQRAEAVLEREAG